jgi:hypothetical protein
LGGNGHVVGPVISIQSDHCHVQQEQESQAEYDHGDEYFQNGDAILILDTPYFH